MYLYIQKMNFLPNKDLRSSSTFFLFLEKGEIRFYDLRFIRVFLETEDSRLLGTSCSMYGNLLSFVG